VDHIGAPQAIGKRFDIRYAYYGQRNHLVLLVRNFGPVSAIVLRYLARSGLDATLDFIRRIASAIVRLLAFIAGTISGGFTGLLLFTREKNAPARKDEKGMAIREALAAHEHEGKQSGDTTMEPASMRETGLETDR